MLLTEAAYVARHYSWELDPVLDLEHRDRHFFIDQLQTLSAEQGPLQ